jgi:CYTH domain-containing protein
MAKYNPFAEKAGMTKVAEQQPPEEALSILKILESLGFDSHLLDSKTHVRSRLETLTNSEILTVKKVFTKQRHTRFVKNFSYHLPFGTRDAYVKEVMGANIDRLVHLIRICGFLMQTKAYLLWKG